MAETLDYVIFHTTVDNGTGIRQTPTALPALRRWLQPTCYSLAVYITCLTNLRLLTTSLMQTLIEGVDFKSELMQNALRGRPSVSYLLSYNGLKLLASNAPSDKGRQYRRHLVQVENKYYELVKQQQANVQKALPPFWKENRFTLADVEPSYQRWCDANNFSASHTTNYIYEQVLGKRAAALRLLPVVDGSPVVACNHVPTADELAIICNVKLRLTKYNRTFKSYKQAVESALVQL